jgi:hypothetical protein
MGWWVPGVTNEDLLQERVLAELEGRDPDKAVRSFLARERRYYDMRAPEFHLEHEERIAAAPLVIRRPKRSLASK